MFITKGILKMIKLAIGLMALLVLVGGCVNKGYVADQISASEARTGSQVSALRDKTDANATEVAKLKQLAS